MIGTCVDSATGQAGAGTDVSGSALLERGVHSFMGAYAKTAPGEQLTYRPADLSRYEGEPFCLRITPEDIDLERCFFVYLDEKFEGDSLRWLFQTYFIAPRPDSVD